MKILFKIDVTFSENVISRFPFFIGFCNLLTDLLSYSKLFIKADWCIHDTLLTKNKLKVIWCLIYKILSRNYRKSHGDKISIKIKILELILLIILEGFSIIGNVISYKYLKLRFYLAFVNSRYLVAFAFHALFLFWIYISLNNVQLVKQQQQNTNYFSKRYHIIHGNESIVMLLLHKIGRNPILCTRRQEFLIFVFSNVFFFLSKAE